MPGVTLFTVVEVGFGEDEKFLQYYRKLKSFLSKQPGFISHQLYRSPAPKNSKRYMVVGKWENTAATHTLTEHEEWKQLMKDHEMVLSPVAFEEVNVD